MYMYIYRQWDNDNDPRTQGCMTGLHDCKVHVACSRAGVINNTVISKACLIFTAVCTNSGILYQDMLPSLYLNV